MERSLMDKLFNKQKKYFLTIQREKQTLFFNASEVEIVGELITFKDKFNKQLVFPITALKEAKEEVE